MKAIIRGAAAYVGGSFSAAPLFIDGGRLVSGAPAGAADFDFSNMYIFPGFADVHVHLREPGFSYKETIRSGTAAAARGGYTAVCSMPNLSPVPDCAAGLEAQLDVISRDALIPVYPYGSITRGERGGELSDFEALRGKVIALSDDGRGVQSESVMRSAMERAAALGLIIAAHCEDESAPPGRSEQSETARDLRLSLETGCKIHICHVSRRETLELIRRAKARGADVSCETAPHYLLLDDSMTEDSGRFKMNPPIGSPSDRLALLEAVADGTVDMIATDHAPHSPEEKGRGFAGSLSGVVGLECAFPALYTGLVRGGIISLERLLELMSAAPRRRFGIPGGLEAGAPADFCVFDLDREYVIRGGEFLSLGRSTPFEGLLVRGGCRMTAAGGEIVWEEKENA